MNGTEWRKRLASHLEASDLSKRQVSLSAGLGPGYVHSILSEGKEPTVDRLLAVCEAANVSLTWVLFGFDVSREDQELLSLLQSSPQAREGILQILRSKQATERA